MNSPWLNITSSDHSIISVSVSDTHGGKHIHLYMTPDLIDTVQWVKQYKSQLAREQQIREHDPAARELYDQYQTYLNITYSK